MGIRTKLTSLGTTNTRATKITTKQYTTAGSYTIVAEISGSMYVEAYGGGGGACYSSQHTYTSSQGFGVLSFNSGGGGGAGFKGYLTLPVGTYTITVGSGGAGKDAGKGPSRISGSAKTYAHGTSGSATILVLGNTTIISCGGGTYGKLFAKSGDYKHIWCSGGDGGTFSGNSSYYSSSPTLASNGNGGNNKSVTNGSSVPSITAAKSLYDNTTTGYGAGGISSTKGKDGYFRIDLIEYV